jgi:hypothetical protein
MQISEPVTMLTDYVLAALAIWFGRALLAEPGGPKTRGRRAWGWAFIALAAGAFAGGTSHGFAVYLDGIAGRIAWKTTVWSIGAASCMMLVAAAHVALRPPATRWLAAFAAFKFGAYFLLMAGQDDFRFVIFDYIPSMGIVLILHLYLWELRGRRAAAWVAAGVVVSFAAAAVQQSGFAIHPSFNHNDLYHVIQMGALYLFFRGARQLADAA